MHMEPGIVDAGKAMFGYATAAGAIGIVAGSLRTAVRAYGVTATGLRSILAIIMVLSFFELLPHPSVGVSEVHFIFGTTLLLLLGLAPAALGLALGLLLQGVFFAPYDLPQLGMNVTTLLVPLFAADAVAKRIIPHGTAYSEVGYGQLLKLSTVYQGGIVSWVAFWAVYGRGLGPENSASVMSFGFAYMGVVIIEPVVDRAVLALAKRSKGRSISLLFQPGVIVAQR